MSPETPARIEPTKLEDVSPEITDVIAELASAAASLGKRLHPATAANLADLVRIMNTYYSNLIEGHNTRPRDIARALMGDFDEKSGAAQFADRSRCSCPSSDRHRYVWAQPAISKNLRILGSFRWLHREFYPRCA